MFTCLLKASLRARKWWSQDSTYSTHSLRLFPKLSLSVVHAGASAQQRDSSGFGGRTPREDGTAAASEWEGRGPLLDILVLLFFEKIIPSLWP